MDALETTINIHDEHYKANREHNLALMNELRERLAQVRQGGGEQYQQRHSDRIRQLAPFSVRFHGVS